MSPAIWTPRSMPSTQTASATYSVAWIDCLARGRGPRPLADLSSPSTPAPPTRIASGPGCRDIRCRAARRSVGPLGLLPASPSIRSPCAPSTRLYFRRGASRAGAPRLVHWDPYFFPLDAIADWNRIYGRRGFLQHQCVIPLHNARSVLAEILDRVSRRGNASFLAVLKQLGDSHGLMSFPMRGYTLAMDFPVTDAAVRLSRRARRAGRRRRRPALSRQGRAAVARHLRGRLCRARPFRATFAQQIGADRRLGLASFRTIGDLAMTDQKTVLVVGGSSDIGHATALRYAAGRLAGLARGARRRHRAAQRRRHQGAHRHRARRCHRARRARRPTKLADFVAGLPALPDTVVCDDRRTRRPGPRRARSRPCRRRSCAPISRRRACCSACSRRRFAARGSGTIVGVSSVAGDRGRGSNYVYGAAKAGFSQFLSGLRNRMALAGNVRVVTVKPGFVRTRMTAHLKLPAPLTVDAGARRRRHLPRRRAKGPRDVIYVGRRFRLVMTIICADPGSAVQETEIVRPHR